VGQLKSGNYRIRGYAALGLGYLGNPQAEGVLIEALGAQNGFLQVKACQALAMVGSRRAVSALQGLSKRKRYNGAMNIQGMAKYAIDRIQQREKHELANEHEGTAK
jgi:HEAT repeat protein